MIKFIKYRIPTLLLSLILILIGLWFFVGPQNINLGFFTPRGLNLGIDFQGGLVHQVTIYSGIDQDEIRELSIESGLGSEIQSVVIKDENRIGNAKSYLIKTIITKEEQEAITEDPNMTPAKFLNDRINKLHGAIKKKYGETYTLKGDELKIANKLYKGKITGEFTKQRTGEKRVLLNVVKESENVISPVYSKTLKVQAIILVLFVLLIMLLYITVRFKFKYAIGAVSALIHDVLIIFGFITVSQLEFDYTMVAAILFIIGYSLNDTIVIFDRVRENYGIMKDYSSVEIINTSINQSLSRTIITSVTTLFAVIALYIWGGPKINGFSITLIAGILSGTYSSIFIASPIVDSWDHFFLSKKQKKKAEIEAKKKEEKKIEKEEKQENNSIKQRQELFSLSKKQLKKISSKKKKR